MKKILPLLMLLPGWAGADYLAVEESGDKEFIGPTTEEIELLSIAETPLYGSDRSIAVKVRNNSQVYLERVAVKCDITDAKGFRLFKGMVFKSDPLFSIRLKFPPISTAERGIPPGAEAEVGVYTDDNRWTRGNGAYNYHCKMYGVGGSE